MIKCTRNIFHISFSNFYVFKTIKFNHCYFSQHGAHLVYDAVVINEDGKDEHRSFTVTDINDAPSSYSNPVDIEFD